MPHFSAKELTLLSTTLDNLSQSSHCVAYKQRFAKNLMQLLNADFFVSYTNHLNENDFSKGIALNMPAAHLAEYEQHYQHFDPITRKLQQYKRAVNVNEVMSQKSLVNSYFYNDFLKRDGLYWGVNLYAYHNCVNIGDIRIWRTRHNAAFSEKEMHILNVILPVFKQALINEAPSLHATNRSINDISAAFSLTSRESEITQLIITGAMDEAIAAQLNISFHTVRSHIKNIFRKLNINNRSALITTLLQK